MYVWRIGRKIYPPLDGEGARLAGGRWNSPGVPVIYTAGTQSLAILETLVHVDPDLIPADLQMYRILVPDDLVLATVDTTQLPSDWREPEHAACRALGDAWLTAAASAVLRVPPAPLQDADEYGYAINPRHAETKRIVIQSVEPFSFDLRLL